MDKMEDLEQQISDIRQLVERGEQLIAAQRRIIAVISEGGLDASGAKWVLESYESTQQSRRRDMNRLQSALKPEDRDNGAIETA